MTRTWIDCSQPCATASTKRLDGVGGRVVRIITRLNQGGPVRQLAALVPELVARGWTGPVLHGRLPPDEIDAAHELSSRGVELLPLRWLERGMGLRKDIRAFHELRQTLRALRPEVVHTHLGKAGALGRLAAHTLGVPCVHTWHGHHFDRPGWRGPLAVRVERQLGRSTGVAVAQSRRQFDDLTRRHRIQDSGRVTLIEPGCHLATLGEPLPAPDARTGLRVLFLGRFVRVKRLDRLIDAVAQANRQTRLRLVGGGPLEADLRRQVQRLGLEDRVELLPGTDDVRTHYAWADVAALTSESEGTPLFLIEAMALGLPVVAFAVGGVPDLVPRRAFGQLVAPGDVGAVARALDACPPGRRLPARLVARVRQRFAAARLAEETAALYASLRALGHRPTPTPDAFTMRP